MKLIKLFVLLVFPMFAFAQMNNPSAPTTAGAGLTKTGNSLSVNYGFLANTALQGNTASKIGGADKIAQFDSSGYFVISNYLAVGAISSPAVLLDGGESGSGLTAAYRLYDYNNNSNSPNIEVRKSRGTISVPVAVNNNDNLARFSGTGYNGSNFTNHSAAITIRATEAFTASATGGQIIFSTTPNGANEAMKVVYINHTGNVLVNTASDDNTNKLQVNGGVSASSYKIGTADFILSGVSSVIGGGALLAGECDSTTVSITGAATGMVAIANPSSAIADEFYARARVSAADTITVDICAAVAGTPASSTYNIRVIR